MFHTLAIPPGLEAWLKLRTLNIAQLLLHCVLPQDWEARGWMGQSVGGGGWARGVGVGVGCVFWDVYHDIRYVS